MRTGKMSSSGEEQSLHRLGVVLAIASIALLIVAALLWVGRVGFFYVGPYPPPWWIRWLFWL